MQSNHYPLVLLDNDNDIFLRTYVWNADDRPVETSETGFGIQNVEYHNDGLSLIPKVFPDQWLRSCIAIAVPSGSVKMVVDGVLVHDTISDALKKAAAKFPTDLTGKIVIGAVKSSAGWKSVNQRVTNLNVFSSALSAETMVKKTEESSKHCDDQGDYLSWKDMKWDIRGDIRFETVAREKQCMKEPKMTLFPAQFVEMSDCMRHCQKIGGRAPKVVSKPE